MVGQRCRLSIDALASSPVPPPKAQVMLASSRNEDPGAVRTREVGDASIRGTTLEPHFKRRRSTAAQPLCDHTGRIAWGEELKLVRAKRKAHASPIQIGTLDSFAAAPQRLFIKGTYRAQLGDGEREALYPGSLVAVCPFARHALVARCVVADEKWHEPTGVAIVDG